MPDTDTDLLKCYAETRSEAAFCTLVERYAGMVMASAVRRTGDLGLAEEATQSVFIILARKASSLQNHPALCAWFYTTTRLQCQSVLRTERRQKRKHQALMKELRALDSNQTPDTIVDDCQPLLDEALDELNETDRRLILLRFIDGANYLDLSHRLGASEVTCRKRVSRALEKLRCFLQRKGVAVPVAALGGVMTTQFEKAAASELSTSIAQQALVNLPTISTPTLIINTLETMAYGKTKAFVAATILATIPLGIQWHENSKLRDQLTFAQAQLTIPPPSLRAVDSRSGAALLSPESRESESTQLSRGHGELPAVPGLHGEGLVFPLPFADIASLGVNPVAENGQLSDQAMRLLRMSTAEVNSINAALTATRSSIWQEEKERVQAIEVSDEKQVYQIEAFPEAGNSIKESLEDVFKSVLGGERGDFLTSRFFRSLDSRRKFGLFGERSRTITFSSEDEGKIFVSVTELNEEGTLSQSYSNAYETIPEEFSHLFQEQDVDEGP
ncbi:MAG: sigma-70 family RNA polymerase sigma factor [Verrucomicrobiales bacterium]